MISDFDHVEVREVFCARSPGWYEAECTVCDESTTGAEPVVEDWYWEHHSKCGDVQ